MNERRTLAILGAISVVLVAVLCAISIFFHRKNELEKNRDKTAQARAKRWNNTEAKNEESNPIIEPEAELKNETIN